MRSAGPEEPTQGRNPSPTGRQLRASQLSAATAAALAKSASVAEVAEVAAEVAAVRHLSPEEAAEADDGRLDRRRIHPPDSQGKQHLEPRARARIVNTTSPCPHSIHPCRHPHTTQPELRAECRY